MRTLKLFVLSIIYGQPVAFLTDLILFRLARSIANLSEARDLSYSMKGYDHSWSHLLEDDESGDPDHEEDHWDEQEHEEEEHEHEEEEDKSYRATFFRRQET